MIYLSQMLGIPVVDSTGEKIGTVNDLGIATGEVFPRVTSLAFQGPGKTPFMISWRKYVDSFDDNEVRLKVPSTDIRFSYLQPTEVLIARDLLNKQIVDTRGMRVVRVNDLKLSDTSQSQLRLLGAEVGARGLLRSLHPALERVACRAAKVFGRDIPESIIAWNYMDLLDRDLSNVKLSVTHRTLDDMHPADIADIIEQLDPRLRGQVFAQLDDAQAALAMAELDDDEMAAEIVGDMSELDASKMLSEMDPDDAAELVGELDYEKAEKLLRLMGVKEQRAVRQLLGYREDTAGRIMTSEFVSLPADATVRDGIARVRDLNEDVETMHYLYLVDDERHLKGVISLRDLVVNGHDTKLADVAETEDVLTVSPEDDQEDVAEEIAKYNLLAIPVVDENRKLLGIVTVDDALDVMREEHEEDLQIAGSRVRNSSDESQHVLAGVLESEAWVAFWALGMLALALVAGANPVSLLPTLAAGASLPIALHVAGTMVRYVTDFFLEYDEDDEDAPSLLGFALRGILVAVAYAVIVGMLTWGCLGILRNALGIVPTSPAFVGAVHGLVTSAIVTVALFVAAPAVLVTLRKMDAADKDISGTSLRLLMYALTTVAFVASVLLLAGSGIVLPMGA